MTASIQPSRRETSRRQAARIALRYAAAALFCGLFAFVYERFSHGVWSAAMVFAWALPLAGGLPFLSLAASDAVRRVPPAAAGFWHAGIAALTVGSLFRGALEIYGTTRQLTLAYPIAGAALCLAGAGWFALDRARARRKAPDPRDARA